VFSLGRLCLVQGGCDLFRVVVGSVGRWGLVYGPITVFVFSLGWVCLV